MTAQKLKLVPTHQSEARDTSFYFRKIDFRPYIVDYLDAAFYGISSLLTPASLIFGGFLLSIIHQENQYENVDILISQPEYHNVKKKFEESHIWFFDKCYEASNTKFSNAAGRTLPQEDDKKPKLLKMMNIFNSNLNKKCYLAMPRIYNENLQFLGSETVISGADLSCCGIASDFYGNIYEGVKNALNDCLNKKFRIMISPTEKHTIEKLEKRITKYIKRGYTLISS